MGPPNVAAGERATLKRLTGEREAMRFVATPPPLLSMARQSG